MTFVSSEELQDLWARHDAAWRDPAQIVSQWEEAAATDPGLLQHTVRGEWWETLARLGITLLVTREYEHLVMAMHAGGRRPHVTFLRLPHPSGLAVDRQRGIVHVASTRNPNQLYDLAPVAAYLNACHRLMALPRLLLVDRACHDRYGGTGTTLDWHALRENRQRLRGMPLVLAGGLTADNVAEAIAAVRPWAVDVASGVESAPGAKSPELVKRFVEAAKTAFGKLPAKN